MLPPGDHRIVVRFVAPALLNAPRVRYRYRLVGAAPAWVELGTSREVQLTHLDPGTFELELQAWLPGEAGRSRAGLVVRHPGALVAAALGMGTARRARLALSAISPLSWSACASCGTTNGACARWCEERTAELQVQTQIAEQLARTDTLTLLANRRAIDQALEAHTRHEQAYPVSLILLDLDSFKPINDQFGHAAGDIALRHVAEVLREHAPPPDIAARWGGDEFAVLLDALRPGAGTGARRAHSRRGGGDRLQRLRARRGASPPASAWPAPIRAKAAFRWTRWWHTRTRRCTRPSATAATGYVTHCRHPVHRRTLGASKPERRQTGLMARAGA